MDFLPLATWTRAAVSSQTRRAGLGLACFALLLSGCAHSRKPEQYERGLTRIFAPHPPPFISGPASVLLTNTAGFRAYARAQIQGFGGIDSTSGQLLGRGSKLLYAPEPSEHLARHQRPGGFAFLWDTVDNRGFLLSEALQAYAPISSSVAVTNILLAAASGPADKVEGHACERATAVLETSDGSRDSFELIRAVDLKGFPVQIVMASNPAALTLSLSKIRLQAPADEVFAVPEGYVKYTSPEAMADELAARQQNLRWNNSAPEVTLPITR